MAEPTSAPSTTASAMASGTRPLRENEVSSIAVAVALCINTVTPAPAKAAIVRCASPTQEPP